MRAIASFVGAILVVALPAQEVPPWRMIRDLEFRGAETFTAEQLTRALVFDKDVLRLIAERIEAKDMPTLAAVIRRAYVRNGFGDAVASGTLDAGKGVITIEEGTRITNGEIRCEGNTIVSTEVIRAKLADTEEGSKKSEPWVASEPAVLGEASLAVAMDKVREAYAEAGRFGSQVEALHATEGATADLVIKVHGEGKTVRVQSIELVGERDEDKSDALARLRWQAGAPINAVWFEDMRTQLEALGRYDRIAFDLPDDIPEVLDPLRIRVHVLGHLSTVAATDYTSIDELRTWIRNITGHLEAGKMIRHELELADTFEWRGLRVAAGSFDIDFARDGFRARCPSISWDRIQLGELELLLTPHSLTFSLGEAHADIAFAQPAGFGLSLTTVFARNGTIEARWGVGMSQRGTGASMMSVHIHPATAGYLLYRPEPAAKREGDDLVVRIAGQPVRVGPGGKLEDRKVSFAIDGWSHRIELADALMADSRAEFRERHPDAATVLGDALRQWGLILATQLRGSETAESAQIRALSSGIVAAIRDFEPSAAAGAKPAEANRMIGAPDLPGDLEPAAMVLAVSCMAGTGWAADLCGGVGTALLGGASVNDCFRSYSEDENNGPIAMVAASLAFNFLGGAEPAAYFRRRAGDRWNFDSAYADLASLFGAAKIEPAIPRAVGAHWRQQTELADLFDKLPAEGDADLAAWRIGLAELWNSGAGEWLREQLLAEK